MVLPQRILVHSFLLIVHTLDYVYYGEKISKWEMQYFRSWWLKLLGFEIANNSNNNKGKLYLLIFVCLFDDAGDFVQYLSRVTEMYASLYVYVIGRFTANAMMNNA